GSATHDEHRVLIVRWRMLFSRPQVGPDEQAGERENPCPGSSSDFSPPSAWPAASARAAGAARRAAEAVPRAAEAVPRAAEAVPRAAARWAPASPCNARARRAALPALPAQAAT